MSKAYNSFYNFAVSIVSGIAGFKSEMKAYYLSEHAYKHTVYPEMIKELHNIHSESRCFIIGNGPSLTVNDLNKLDGEITFAANTIFNIFDDTDWRPTYYASQDDKLIPVIIERSLKIESKGFFFPYNLYDVKIPNRNNIYRYFVDKTDMYPELPHFSDDISSKIYECYTISYTMIQLAIYMGFKEIYLLGMDHSFAVEVKADGTIVHNNVKNHFGNSEEIIENQYLPSTDKSTNAFIAAKKYADAHGIKIYNATRGGKLEVFERVNLDDIVKEKI
ncbi:MAG: DUF115 domain-containing protein [Clostridia bacterium]|nr:DUF115 domain-containing protein [Clostridia bacterium]